MFKYYGFLNDAQMLEFAMLNMPCTLEITAHAGIGFNVVSVTESTLFILLLKSTLFRGLFFRERAFRARIYPTQTRINSMNECTSALDHMRVRYEISHYDKSDVVSFDINIPELKILFGKLKNHSIMVAPGDLWLGIKFSS